MTMKLNYLLTQMMQMFFTSDVGSLALIFQTLKHFKYIPLLNLTLRSLKHVGSVQNGDPKKP